MSELRVTVVIISEVKSHPNADAISIATVGGWQTVIKRDQFKDGDLVVYFPPDALIPASVSDALGVTTYLSKGRVRSIRLRGEASHGFVIAPEAGDVLGDDVTERYGVTKYEPPQKVFGGDHNALPEIPEFQVYTSIENLRNYPNVIADGEQVLVTEKLHGTNCRVGLVGGEFVAGSHNLRRSKPDAGDTRINLYWFPLSDENLVKLLRDLEGGHGFNVSVYCEVYGYRVQGADFSYDAGTQLAYRVFDIAINGAYLDFELVARLCKFSNVPLVPILRECPYSLDTIRGIANGKSEIGGVLEGVVVRPAVETTHPKIGRVVLKFLSDEFLVKQSKNRDNGREEIAH
jgi:RNA ligase (TIGR02306 family)